jgi:hypothetical protein
MHLHDSDTDIRESVFVSVGVLQLRACSVVAPSNCCSSVRSVTSRAACSCADAFCAEEFS